MIIAQGDQVVIGGQFYLLPDDRECAWAERRVRVDPDIAWILGNFVEADNANDNGHIFPLEDLTAGFSSVMNKPLNVLHQGRYIVGAYVDAELVEPEDMQAAEGHRIVEALASFWRHQFPEEYELVKRAHSEGAAFYSMECIPEEIACAADGCGTVSKYVGRSSDTYCEHMKDGYGAKKLLKPHFSAGALILPPVKPGWRRADIRSLAKKTDSALLESVYAQVEMEMPHLGPQEWEHFMAQIVEQAKTFSPDQRDKMAKQGTAMPHGGFPIKTAQDLKNAIQAIGRAKDPAAAKAHIKKRAAALGLSKLIPDGW